MSTVVWPSGARGRALAGGLLLLVVVAVIALISVPTWWAWARYERLAAEAEDKLDRYRRIAVNRDDYRRALDAVKVRESSRFFLKNTATTQAGTELTDLVRVVVESGGGRITSIQPATVKDDAGYRLYTLPVGFVATPANLTKVLLTLETQLPYLLLDVVTLRSTVVRGYKGVPNVEPEVSVTLEVQAYGPKAPTRNATGSAPNPARSEGRT